MRFLKQRWVIAALAVAATTLFIIYGWPKLKEAFNKKNASVGNGGTTPANGTTTGQQPGFASLQSRLIGPVMQSSN